jgi:CheY-like chemotaxis protein
MSSRSVLVVDDDQDNRALLTMILEDDSYPVLQASSGGDALKLICQQRINLVILDLVLPDIKGELVARRIKREHPTLGIVAISASPERQLQARTSQVDAFLAKPFDLDDFLEVVHRLAPRCGRDSRQVSPSVGSPSDYAFSHSSIDGTCSAQPT